MRSENRFVYLFNLPSLHILSPHSIFSPLIPCSLPSSNSLFSLPIPSSLTPFPLPYTPFALLTLFSLPSPYSLFPHPIFSPLTLSYLPTTIFPLVYRSIVYNQYPLYHTLLPPSLLPPLFSQAMQCKADEHTPNITVT